MSILNLLWRNIKWRFHNGFTIIITILQPMLWLVLYSTIAGGTMKNMGIENYTAFILPGLVVLVSFSACCSSGIMNYLMKNDGSFYRILIAPVKRTSIIIGQLMEASLCTLFEVAVMFLVSLFFSVKVASGLQGILLIIIIVLLTSLFMAGAAYSISLILPNEVLYETVMNAIVLPIFFLSPALFPQDKITEALKVLVSLNPFTYIINALRDLILQPSINYRLILGAVVIILIMDMLSFSWALLKIKKEE